MLKPIEEANGLNNAGRITLSSLLEKEFNVKNLIILTLGKNDNYYVVPGFSESPNLSFMSEDGRVPITIQNKTIIINDTSFRLNSITLYDEYLRAYEPTDDIEFDDTKEVCLLETNIGNGLSELYFFKNKLIIDGEEINLVNKRFTNQEKIKKVYIY